MEAGFEVVKGFLYLYIMIQMQRKLDAIKTSRDVSTLYVFMYQLYE